MKSYKTITLIAIVVIISFNCWAEVRQNPVKVYELGNKAFAEGDYNKASILLKEAITMGLPSRKLDSARVTLWLIDLPSFSSKEDIIRVGKHNSKKKVLVPLFYEICARNKRQGDSSGEIIEWKSYFLLKNILDKVMVLVAEESGIVISDSDIESHILNNLQRERLVAPLKDLTPKELREVVRESFMQMQGEELVKSKSINSASKFIAYMETYKKQNLISINKELIKNMLCSP